MVSSAIASLPHTVSDFNLVNLSLQVEPSLFTRWPSRSFDGLLSFHIINLNDIASTTEVIHVALSRVFKSLPHLTELVINGNGWLVLDSEDAAWQLQQLRTLKLQLQWADCLPSITAPQL